MLLECSNWILFDDIENSHKGLKAETPQEGRFSVFAIVVVTHCHKILKPFITPVTFAKEMEMCSAAAPLSQMKEGVVAERKDGVVWGPCIGRVQLLWRTFVIRIFCC